MFVSGNTDINNGNLKLILGLIWSLIAHYQLGASNFPPKKLMLAWLKVRCLPKRTIVQSYPTRHALRLVGTKPKWTRTTVKIDVST